jgi:hypothetical protein
MVWLSEAYDTNRSWSQWMRSSYHESHWVDPWIKLLSSVWQLVLSGNVLVTWLFLPCRGGSRIIMTWRTRMWTGWFTGCATNVYHWANCDSDSCMLWMHVFTSSWCTPHLISRTCKTTVWCKSYHVCNLRGWLWAIVDFSKPSNDVCFSTVWDVTT